MPATTFYELLKRDAAPTGCGVLVVRDGKILTGTRIERASRGQICGPGGHIEAGETPEEAARREAHEEFGITCHDLTPLGVQDGGRHGRSAVFLCRSFSGTPQTDEEEMTAPKWLSPEEIKGQETFPPFLQSLELLQKGAVAKTLEGILKYNHSHDSLGRFSSSNGGGAAAAAPSTNDTKEFDPFAELMAMAEEAESKPPEKPKAISTEYKLDEHGAPEGQAKGKDITDSFEPTEEYYPSGAAVSVMDQVAEAQGFKGKPTVVPREVFDEAAKRTGVIAFRTFNDGEDIVSGKEVAEESDFAKQLMYGEGKDFSLNGNGPQAYGGGIYFATNKLSETTEGKTPDGFHARADSTKYGTSADPAVVTMTLSPTAHIGNYSDLRSRFYDETEEVRNRFNMDIGAYAASIGYDGLRVQGAGSGCDYLTVFNRTALIISADIEDLNGNKYQEMPDWMRNLEFGN